MMIRICVVCALGPVVVASVAVLPRAVDGLWLVGDRLPVARAPVVAAVPVTVVIASIVARLVVIGVAVLLLVVVVAVMLVVAVAGVVPLLVVAVVVVVVSTVVAVVDDLLEDSLDRFLLRRQEGSPAE